MAKKFSYKENYMEVEYRILTTKVIDNSHNLIQRK